MPHPDRALVADVAAIERTTLAWERTALGLAGVGALLVHAGRSHLAAHLVAGLMLEVVALLVVVVVAPVRHRRLVADVRAGRSPVRPALPAVAATVVAVVVLAVAAVELRG